MEAAELLLTFFGFVMREALLFAACGFLLLGLSDLAVDAIWIAKTVKRRLGGHVLCADGLPPARAPGRIAIFVPAWDEGAVIDDMLRTMLDRFGEGDYLIFVGTYPNDPATIEAVRAIADERVRLVVGPIPGKTTKADCLNRLWEALLAEERALGRCFKAVVLHDAEDLVHRAELAMFDRLIEEHDFVQLPVLPLVEEASFVSKSYADEFAESHGKELVVRQLLGASIPSAGVGCAFARDALEMVASRNGGLPFQPDSLTEDYELGLRLHACGARSVFVRLRSSRHGPIVATREYFPGTIKEAVAQKSR